MKTKSALLLALICALATFFCVACGTQTDNPVGGGGHEHSYVEVAEVPSTCATAGTKAHYKCEGCSDLFLKEGEDYVKVEESELTLALSDAHSFDGIEITTAPFKTTYTAFETFDKSGMAVAKHCSVCGASTESVAYEDITFDYEKEGADKLTGDMTKVIIKAAGYQVDLSVTVNKIAVEFPEIAESDYSGEAQTATVAESELYTVIENNGGTEIGTYDVKLQLTDSVNYAFEGVEGDVATLEFKITKAANAFTFGEPVVISCGGVPAIGVTAKEEAVVYFVYSSTEDGEFTEAPDGGFTAGTYYAKAIAEETASYKRTVSEAVTFTVEHEVETWNTESDEQDIGVCSCGENVPDAVFNKKVTDARQDILLTDSTASITLVGVSEYQTVKAISYGDLNLGTDLSALKIALDNVPNPEDDGATQISPWELVVHGEQNLTVIVIDDNGGEHIVLVPVTLITQSFTDVRSIIDTLGYRINVDTGKTHEGKHYILANDVTYDGSYNADTWDAGIGRGFAGTFDGRNHTITGGNMYCGGLFGMLDGATVKNIKFVNVNPVGQNRTLITMGAYNSVIENIDVKTSSVSVSETADNFQYFGVIAASRVDNLTLRNINIDLGDSVIPWAFGRGWDNCAEDFHCENVTIKAGSIGYFAMASSTGGTYFDQVTGVNYHLNGKVQLTEDNAIDPKQFGASYEYTYTFEAPWDRYTQLKSVTLNGTAIEAELLDNVLVLGNLPNEITSDLYSATASFVVEFDVGENSSVKVTLKVPVLDTRAEAELSTRQDVILKDASGEKTTFTLDLGSEFEGYTVTAVRYGEESLTVTDGAATISDTIKNDTHGEKTIYATATNGVAEYRITVPVTIVTESFSSVRTIIDTICCTPSDTGKIHENKYFILADDVTFDGTYCPADWNNVSDRGDQYGFAGTFDGRNHTISGGNMYGGGLFGMLNGATVKNLKFTDVDPVGANRTLIAAAIYNSVIENIEIKTKTVVVDTTTNFHFFGVISSGRVVNLTMKNVTIDMVESEVPWVLGKGWDNSKASNYTCENVVIKAKAMECLAKNSNSDGATLALDAVDGITVILSGTTTEE